MKATRILLLISLLALGMVHATVFEAEKSEDVDLFLDTNQKETIGLMFYDGQANNKDTQGWFSSLSSKILGIFMSQDQFGRSTEDWVEMFDDKLHLMRIDARNPKLMRTREEFAIEEDLPFIVIQDKQRTVLREKVNEDTYDHVRQLLDRRPNILHKTGGAALKSFNLEPDAEKEDTEPRIIQYFDLEEGEPTNVEEPIQRQYVNWGATDVIGPDGKWMERGRNWVTSYEIPNSGIKNQENRRRVSIQDRIKDDPRPNQSTPPSKPRTGSISMQGSGQPAQNKGVALGGNTAPTAGSNQAQFRPQAVRPGKSIQIGGQQPTQNPQARPPQATSGINAQASTPPSSGSTGGQTTPPPTQGTLARKPVAPASSSIGQSSSYTTNRPRYHDRDYQGYGRPYHGRY